jgi:protein-S-isoprenylcysteine O-methyltransferase Ste14
MHTKRKLVVDCVAWYAQAQTNKQTLKFFCQQKIQILKTNKSQDMFSHVVLQLSLLVVCDFLFPRPPQEVVGGWVQSFSFELAKLGVDAMV